MAKDPILIPKEDYLLLCKSPIIFRSDWNTENTYDTIFKPTPKKSGVYLIVANTFYPFKREIIYIGSSKNLYIRSKGHEVIKKHKVKYDHIQFYFKECEDYIEKEIDLIKSVQPKINKQWR